MMMKSKLKQSLIVTAISAVTIYFVIFFKTDLTQYRIAQQVWNLGHIFLFIGLNYVFYKKILHGLNISIAQEFIIVVLCSFFIGMLIELIQMYTGRDKSNYDVLLDVVGASIAFLLFSRLYLALKIYTKLQLASLVLIFSAASLYPMYVNVIDAIHQRMEFPLLLANKNKHEVTRFNKNNVEIFLDTAELGGISKQVMNVSFKPEKYPTINLESFNEEWSDYNFLVFSIYNPANSVSKLVIRIHDSLHQQHGFNFSDRFNQQLKLESGWNNFKISLKHVKYAPINRDMNMDKIESLMFFKINPQITETLYFSDIKLVK